MIVIQDLKDWAGCQDSICPLKKQHTLEVYSYRPVHQKFNETILLHRTCFIYRMQVSIFTAINHRIFSNIFWVDPECVKVPKTDIIGTGQCDNHSLSFKVSVLIQTYILWVIKDFKYIAADGRRNIHLTVCIVHRT